MTNIDQYKEQIKNLEARVIAQRAEINRLNKRRDTVERDLKRKLIKQQYRCEHCWLLEHIVNDSCIQKAVLRKLRVKHKLLEEDIMKEV